MMAPVLTNYLGNGNFGHQQQEKKSTSVVVCELITTAGEMIQRENPIKEYSNSIIFG